MTEIEKARGLLAYAIVHAEAGHKQSLKTFAVLAEHGIPPSHPAYREMFRTMPTNWNVRPVLIEAALGRKLREDEGVYDGMRELQERVRAGITIETD